MKNWETDFGEGYSLITIENDHGVKLAVTDLGARIVSLEVPLANGEVRNAVLGFDSASEYLTQNPAMGATIGRVAGRVAKGTFTIDGETFHTTINENGNTLHGGSNTFNVMKWDYEIQTSDNATSVVFKFVSPDQDNGFPGNLTTQVTYTLDNDNRWTVIYDANTDHSTLFNPTNHVYFNLDKKPLQTIEQHRLSIDADTYFPIDADHLTTGEQLPVDQTAFDFREAKPLGEMFASQEEQIVNNQGMDHPLWLNAAKADGAQATLTASDDQLSVEMTTSFPSVVIFSSNFDEQFSIPTKVGSFKKHTAITLEAQDVPGTENHPEWGNIVLEKGKPYHQDVVYKLVF